MSPQHSIPHRVERAAPKSTRIDREQIRDPLQHLSGSLIREGKQQDVSRIDPVLEQVRHAVGECARFAATRAGDDEQRTGRSRHRRKLLFV